MFNTNYDFKYSVNFPIPFISIFHCLSLLVEHMYIRSINTHLYNSMYHRSRADWTVYEQTDTFVNERNVHLYFNINYITRILYVCM